MAQFEKCIYCETMVDMSKGEGDHIIPAALGEFLNDVRFNRICPECNSKIGASEQQLLRCGPESFMRDVVKPTMPTRRQRGRSRAKTVMGTPGPEQMIDRGDHHEIVKPSYDDPRDVFPIDQIVFHDQEGREHFIRLFPGMRPEQLRERIEKIGIQNIPKKAWLHCDDGQWSEYKRLYKAAYPNAKIEEIVPTEAGVHRTQGRIKLTVTDHYFRALAKIGFHYYLAHSRRRFRGDEDCFVSIRNFIINGGDHDPFFLKSDRIFAMPFGRLPLGGVVTPNQWCHILAADESGDVVVVYVQLFVGRGCMPFSHYIKLATIESPLVVPTFVWGHVYLYDDPQKSVGYAGHVEEAQIT